MWINRQETADFCKATLIKIPLHHGCSPVNLLYVFRTFVQNTFSGWLFLETPHQKFLHEFHWVNGVCVSIISLCRSSPREVFLGKGALKICCKFRGTNATVWFQQCWIFSGQCFITTPLEGWFCLRLDYWTEIDHFEVLDYFFHFNSQDLLDAMKEYRIRFC